MSINPSLGRAKVKRHSIFFSWRKNFSPIVCWNPFVLRKGCKINTNASRFSMSMAVPTIYFRIRLSWRYFSVQRHFRQHVGERSLVGVLTFRWWCRFFYIFILNIWVNDFLVGVLVLVRAYSFIWKKCDVSVCYWRV